MPSAPFWPLEPNESESNEEGGGVRARARGGRWWQSGVGWKERKVASVRWPTRSVGSLVSDSLAFFAFVFRFSAWI